MTAAYGVAVLGDALAVMVLAGVVLPAASRVAAFLNSQRLTRRVSWLRVLAFGGFWAAALIGIALIPWPCRVTAPLVIEPENAHHVYAVVAGTLASSARPGDNMEKGQEVARLLNSDIRREVVQLTGKRDEQRRQLAALHARQALDSAAAALIPTAEAALADLEERLRQRQLDEQSLVLRAPLAGTVLPPADIPASAQSPGQLSTWSGSPLDERNRGCQIEPGALVCVVGSPRPVEAVVVVDQDSIALIQLGQAVHVRIDLLPGEVYEGRVVEIASRDLKVMPRELASGAELPTARRSPGSRPAGFHHLPGPSETGSAARGGRARQPGSGQVFRRIAIAVRTAATHRAAESYATLVRACDS